MNFKPTKIKTIITIVLFIISFILLYLLTSLTTGCVPMGCIPECVDFDSLTPITHCECCISFSTVLIDWLSILLPGIIFYVIYSLAEKSKGKNQPIS